MSKLTDKFLELFRSHMRRKAEAAYVIQDRTERKRRLKTIITLSAELERVRAVNIFATGFGEMAIEAVIEGDWDLLVDIRKDLAFTDAAFNDLWARFRSIIKEAVEARRIERTN